MCTGVGSGKGCIDVIGPGTVGTFEGRQRMGIRCQRGTHTLARRNERQFGLLCIDGRTVVTLETRALRPALHRNSSVRRA